MNAAYCREVKSITEIELQKLNEYLKKNYFTEIETDKRFKSSTKKR